MKKLFIVLSILLIIGLTYYSLTYKYEINDRVYVIRCSSANTIKGNVTWTGIGIVKEKIFFKKYRVKCIKADFAMFENGHWDKNEPIKYLDLLLKEKDLKSF